MALVLFHFLRYREAPWLVYEWPLLAALQLCELSRFLAGQQRNPGFKFSCRLVSLVACFNISCSNFPTDSLWSIFPSCRRCILQAEQSEHSCSEEPEVRC